MHKPPPHVPPFKSLQYTGMAPGPRLIITGAVHGNEVCGTRAIERLAAELDAGTMRVARGLLTLVPVCNPMAYALQRRTGDRNLNRALQPTATPREFEDHVANWLCPLLAAHEGLLDLHSFQAEGGEPFVMVGPQDNRGEIEPFSQAAKEQALARRLGVRRAVDGWLGTYAMGVQQRLAQAGPDAAARLDLNPRYGVGTTEYMRTQGGWGLTLECGAHADAASVEVAYHAIRHTLAHLQLVEEAVPAEVVAMEALTLFEVIDRHHADDRFTRPWQSFDRLRAGELIAVRADGREERAAGDGWIVFPNARAEPRTEWYYLARPSTRF